MELDTVQSGVITAWETEAGRPIEPGVQEQSENIQRWSLNGEKKR